MQAGLWNFHHYAVIIFQHYRFLKSHYAIAAIAFVSKERKLIWSQQIDKVFSLAPSLMYDEFMKSKENIFFISENK